MQTASKTNLLVLKCNNKTVSSDRASWCCPKTCQSAIKTKIEFIHFGKPPEKIKSYILSHQFSSICSLGLAFYFYL